MKRYYPLTMLIILAMLFVACAPLPVAEPADTGPAEEQAEVVAEDEAVKLTLWSRSATEEVVEALVERWNDNHDNQIEITIIPSDQFVTKFSTAIAGGQAPDLAVIDLIYTPAYMSADQLTDISDLAKGLPYFDDLSPAHVSLGTWEDGKIYALPFAAEGSFLMYNKDLFEQAGLDPESPPQTWDEIYEAAQAINALGDDIYGYYFSGACAGCNAFTFAPLIWASDGDVLSADYSQPTLESDEVKAALHFYRRMWEEGLIPEGAKVDNGADFFNAFTTGKIGMTGIGAFGINGLKTEHPDINFGATFLPGETGGRSSFAGGDNIAIPKGSENIEEAFEFLEWIYSEDVQLEQYAQNSQLPVRTDLAENEFFEADPRLTTATQAMAIGHAPYSVKYNDLFNDGNGPWLAMLQKAIFDGDVDGAVAEAQERFNEIMSE